VGCEALASRREDVLARIDVILRRRIAVFATRNALRNRSPAHTC
jgi:hypothetical protein